MSKLNLDQVLILSDIFSEMKIENMPLGLSTYEKEAAQAEFNKAYLIEDKKEMEAAVKAIQSKYGADIIPAVIKFVAGNLGKAKEPLKEFVANYKGISTQEASKLGIRDITKVIFEIKDEILEVVKDFLASKEDSEE